MADSLRGLAANLRGFAQTWPSRGARVAGAEIERQLFADTGGDGRLSNMRGGGASVDVSGGGGSAEAGAGGNLGLWSMLEDGTKRHTVEPTRRRAILTPYGPRRRAVVGGMAGRRTWTTGAARGLVEAKRDAAVAFGEAVNA